MSLTFTVTVVGFVSPGAFAALEAAADVVGEPEPESPLPHPDSTSAPTSADTTATCRDLVRRWAMGTIAKRSLQSSPPRAALRAAS
ncbi:hypothetical protein [Nocardia sp. NPDC052566]|uniref:hypothetical protein n=1 Tax=Nocardia sp. NPDC052566 TaxID=3364330 RepID=UPI0037C9EBFD